MFEYLYNHLYKIKRALYKNLIAKRTKNDFATHLPILIIIAKIFKIRKVVEFGCGNYSTLTFTDKSIFPDLISIEFFEDNYLWYKKISDEFINKDKRVKSNFVEDGDISKVVDYSLLENVDLIFIDDSHNQLARSKTISKVSKNLNQNSLVIIHDYETGAYIHASKRIKYKYNFNALYPNTGLMTNSIKLEKKLLQKINIFIWLMKKEENLNSKDFWNILFLKYRRILLNSYEAE